jgi:hypothetical protein
VKEEELKNLIDELNGLELNFTSAGQ